MERAIVKREDWVTNLTSPEDRAAIIARRREHLLSIGITEKNLHHIARIRETLVPISTLIKTMEMLSNMVPDPVKFVNKHIWVIRSSESYLEDNFMAVKLMLKEYQINADIKLLYHQNPRLFTQPAERLAKYGEIAWEYGGRKGFIERFNSLVIAEVGALNRAYMSRTKGEKFSALADRINASMLKGKSPNRERLKIETTARHTTDPGTIKSILMYGDKALVSILRGRGLMPRTDT